MPLVNRAALGTAAAIPVLAMLSVTGATLVKLPRERLLPAGTAPLVSSTRNAPGSSA